jgi:ESCRT-I complex subunit VPS28
MDATKLELRDADEIQSLISDLFGSLKGLPPDFEGKAKPENLYAIIKTTEYLERAFIKDAINVEQYESACAWLIVQFKFAEKGLIADGSITHIGGWTAGFVEKYRMDCPKGIYRLLIVGAPAGLDGQDNQSEAVHIAEAVQHFNTAMDAIKLELRDVDEIQPLISDLLYFGLNKVKGLPSDFEGKAKPENWLKTLNAMRAYDRIDDEQARQLLFDLDESYSSFLRFVNEKNVEREEEKIEEKEKNEEARREEERKEAVDSAADAKKGAGSSVENLIEGRVVAAVAAAGVVSVK